MDTADRLELRKRLEAVRQYQSDRKSSRASYLSSCFVLIVLFAVVSLPLDVSFLQSRGWNGFLLLLAFQAFYNIIRYNFSKQIRPILEALLDTQEFPVGDKTST
jgi:hypothetical protein